MQIQFRRAGATLALGALLALAGSSVSMAQARRPAENTLLGVTLLKSSYRDVLKRFGRPDEIQAGGPFIPEQGAPASSQASGGAKGGGLPGFGGSPGMAGYPGMGGGSPGMPGGGGGGGKRVTSKNGFPGKSGTGSAAPGGAGGYPAMGGGSGSPGMSGYPGMGGGLPGFGGSPGMAGYPGMGGGSPGMASPGMGGYPGMGSGSPGFSGEGAAMPGMGGGAPGMSGGAAGTEEKPEYEATWWYHDKKNGLHKSFLFNKDGRVIQVQEYGHDVHHKGSKTRMGVGLGSGFNQVLRTYGWSNDGANDGRNMIMRFGGEEKVAFQLVNNVVVGITIAVVKDVAPAEEAQ